MLLVFVFFIVRVDLFVSDREIEGYHTWESRHLDDIKYPGCQTAVTQGHIATARRGHAGDIAKQHDALDPP